MNVAALKMSPSRLSDGKLRMVSFRFHDPERSIERFNRNKPDASRGLDVIGYYDETPPGGRKANPNPEFVWCCHCQKPTHWKGYVIQDGDGELFIIGAQNCGKDHYGVQFDSAEAQFNNQLRRQSVLERWDLAAARAAPLQTAIETLLHCEPLRRIEKLRQDVVKASETCARLLRRHAKTAAPLLLHIVERDHEAERVRQEKYEQAVRAFQYLTPAIRKERRVAGLGPELDESPIYRTWTDNLGHLEGGDFLIDDRDVRATALELRKTIGEVRAIVRQGTEGVPTTILSRHIRALSDQTSELFRRCENLSFL